MYLARAYSVIRQKRLPSNVTQRAGFSLVELMVGLVIGLLATLVIMQIFSAFEGQKRTTMGTADAQTSGSVALYSIQREVQLAGYALPLYDPSNMPLGCATATPDTVSANGAAAADGVTDVDHDNNAATDNINLSPIDIIDGDAAGVALGGVQTGASDSLIIRYGDSASAGVQTNVVAAAANTVSVLNNQGCNQGDVVYVVRNTDCVATRVNDALLLATTATRADPVHIVLANAAGIVIDAKLACLGAWNQFRYQVTANQLTRTDARQPNAATPVVDGIVNIQAQYGISANPQSNLITSWVDATGAWATPGNLGGNAVCNAATAQRGCIKAVRVALVARNSLLETTAVSTACSSVSAANPTGLCAWDATSANPVNATDAPTINLSLIAGVANPDWDHYRYKVYETIIPLRNIIWTSPRL
ncbi:MAG: PilW family protein [Betaproteobacteria bacterium]